MQDSLTQGLSVLTKVPSRLKPRRGTIPALESTQRKLQRNDAVTKLSTFGEKITRLKERIQKETEERARLEEPAENNDNVNANLQRDSQGRLKHIKRKQRRVETPEQQTISKPVTLQPIKLELDDDDYYDEGGFTPRFPPPTPAYNTSALPKIPAIRRKTPTSR